MQEEWRAEGTLAKEELDEIEADIREVESRDGLFEEARFAERARAADFLEYHVLDRCEGRLAFMESGDRLRGLYRRARRLKDKLERADRRFFARLRAGIRRGEYTGADLRYWLEACGSLPSGDTEENAASYDVLDLFAAGLLRISAGPGEIRPLEPEMVAYQPTPVRVILELVERVPMAEDDVFYDLGSGLGQVAILVSLLTGVRARGGEVQPSYCDRARRCARALRLPRVTFVNLDARRVDYTDGTVFYLYTPFVGGMLREVLAKLEDQVRTRVLRICTYGPCTSQVALQPWLRPVYRRAGQVSAGEDELAVWAGGPSCRNTDPDAGRGPAGA